MQRALEFYCSNRMSEHVVTLLPWGKVYILVGDSLQGALIIETKITSVDDIVGPSLLRQIIQRFQVT